MNTPLVLYSTNTWLAYMISKRYYKDEHYIWCTPYFDPKNNHDSAVPPTSSPLETYRRLAEEVSHGDKHSQKIKENKAGILRGANAKKMAGIINENQEKEIVSIVDLAEQRDFHPLLYVIPYSLVADKLIEPSPEDKAHPLSAEYIINNLDRSLFDVLDFGDL